MPNTTESIAHVRALLRAGQIEEAQEAVEGLPPAALVAIVRDLVEDLNSLAQRQPARMSELSDRARAVTQARRESMVAIARAMRRS